MADVIKKKVFRRCLSINDRVKIIKRLDAGDSGTKLADEFRVSKAAISVIKKRKENILKTKEILETCKGDVNRKRYRGTEEKAFERVVYEWYSEQRQKDVIISGPQLQKKAREFNKQLGGPDTFKASSGWLDSFKKRHKIKLDSSLPEEPPADYASSDEFVDKIVGIMNDEDVAPDFIYTCNLIGLFWKAMPEKSTAKKKRVFCKKKPRNRITVMACVNASGTHKMNLFIIGKYAYPKCLMGINNLPVVYGHQDQVMMDDNLLMEWYTNVFIPEVNKKHDLTINEDKRIVLVLDNRSGTPSEEDFNNVCNSSRVLFFPPNTTELIHPMHHVIADELKRRYRRILLTRILAEDDSEEGKDYVDSLTLLDCVNFCTLAWNEVSPVMIKNCWRKLIPCGFEYSADVESVKISSLHALLVKIPNFGLLTMRDTTNWLDVDARELGHYVRCDDDNSDNVGEQVVEELEDEIADDDLEFTEDNIDSTNPTIKEGLKGFRTFIHWYQTYEDSCSSALREFLECQQLVVEKIVENNR